MVQQPLVGLKLRREEDNSNGTQRLAAAVRGLQLGGRRSGCTGLAGVVRGNEGLI